VTGARAYSLLLAPGASASRDQPSLVAMDRAATAVGWQVTRMDFAYRLAGRRAPPKSPALVADVTAQAADLGSPRVLGGRSMGGRICSMAAALGVGAAGLVLVSYPLHPPGRPDRLRTEHFPKLSMPCLFVSGTRDAFGTPDELREATAAIPGPVTHHFVEGKDHAMRNADATVAELVVAWLTAEWGHPG
jgi:uncharacterized protein